MKNIFYILIILCAILFKSCDVLDLKPLDQITEADTWSDEALIEIYVNANYNSILHGFRAELLTAACDEAYCIHNYGNMYTVQKGELTSDNVEGVDTNINFWKHAYSNIRNINTFFNEIEKAPVEEAFRKRTKGEMKFIRAYLYANLIWRYGGVPIITNLFELNGDYTVTRASYDACVDFIIAELEEAIELLPAQQPASELGRASGDACKALKSRVLLYAASPLQNPDNQMAKWQKAADAAEVLLNSNYTLINDYQTLFLEDNNEIIFARYFTQANSTNFHLYNGRNGSNGWTAENPTQNHVNAYEMAATGELPYTEQANGSLILNTQSGYDPNQPYVGRDPRFYASILYDGAMWAERETETYHGGLDSPESSIGSWNASRTAYAFKKFMIEDLPPTGTSLKPTNPWIHFRYGEILLNYAEAKFELGDEDTAREYLNKIRSRTSVQMPPVTDSGEQLRKRIQNERRVELAFEGHRFFDVRRWKIAMETENRDILAMDIVKAEDGSKTYTPVVLLGRSFLNQHYLIPIPRAEIDKSLGSLTQNPNY